MPEVAAAQVRWSSQRAWATELRAALMRAGLSEDAAMIAMAHSALSCGALNHPAPEMWNRIFWGIKSWTDRQNFVRLYGNEEKDSKPTPRSLMRWVSSETTDEAVKLYLSVLRGAKLPSGTLRYSRSLAFLQAGSPNYFAQLGADGWYTASPTRMDIQMRGYWRTLRQMFGLDASGFVLVSVLLAITAAAAWLAAILL